MKICTTRVNDFHSNAESSPDSLDYSLTNMAVIDEKTDLYANVELEYDWNINPKLIHDVENAHYLTKLMNTYVKTVDVVEEKDPVKSNVASTIDWRICHKLAHNDNYLH